MISKTGLLRAAKSTLVAVLLSVGLPVFAFAARFTHATDGYAIDYPDEWHVRQDVLNVGGPLLLTSVPPDRLLRGGIIPPGAASISVRLMPPEQSEGQVLSEFQRDQEVRRSAQRFGGRTGERLEYEFDVGSSVEPFVIVTVKVVTRVGPKLVLFQLMYSKQGAVSVKWEQVLSDVVASVSLSKEE